MVQPRAYVPPNDARTVSIIMNAFNREKVIHFAIESVLAQTFEDFELIIVDDASTDRTAAIAAHYVGLDPRVHLVRNVNNSRSWHIPWESKNDGLRLARGRLISYLDSDNTWHPDFLKTLVAELERDESIQLVHCDTRNFYSAEECAHVKATDRRRLVYHDDISTVFTHDDLDVSKLGFEAYIDTNEMMHRASVFEQLGCLWRVYNPRRVEIQAFQGNRFPYRRHNDIDLVSRIVDAFGPSCIRRVPQALTNFYYPSAPRPSAPACPVDLDNREPCSALTDVSFRLLNVAHFRTEYLQESSSPSKPLFDFGVGMLRGWGEASVERVFRDFAASGGFGDRMFRYRGQVTVAALYRKLSELYGDMFWGRPQSEHAVVPFDGCQNALCSTVVAVCDERDNAPNSEIIYQAPAASYWTTVAAARRRGRAIFAHSYSDFLDGLRQCRGRIGAILLSVPHNPLGIVPTVAECSELCRIVEEEGAWLIVDVTYHVFGGVECQEALRTLAKGRAIFCDGVSKSWGLPGLRLGFAISSHNEIMARIRSQKSAESFLPSSLKQAFLMHLLEHHGDIPRVIAKDVRSRRLVARSALEALELEMLGVELPQFLNTSLYEVLYVDGLMKQSGMTTTQLSDHLAAKVGVKVTPDVAFYPPGLLRCNQKPFLRISIGAETRINEGLSLMADGFRSALASSPLSVESVASCVIG